MLGGVVAQPRGDRRAPRAPRAARRLNNLGATSPPPGIARNRASSSDTRAASLPERARRSNARGGVASHSRARHTCVRLRASVRLLAPSAGTLRSAAARLVVLAHETAAAVAPSAGAPPSPPLPRASISLPARDVAGAAKASSRTPPAPSSMTRRDERKRRLAAAAMPASPPRAGGRGAAAASAL